MLFSFTNFHNTSSPDKRHASADPVTSAKSPTFIRAKDNKKDINHPFPDYMEQGADLMTIKLWHGQHCVLSKLRGNNGSESVPGLSVTFSLGS